MQYVIIEMQHDVMHTNIMHVGYCVKCITIEMHTDVMQTDVIHGTSSVQCVRALM